MNRYSLVETGTVFHHPGTDPYSRQADRNFNHAPNIIRLSDGSLFTCWFSTPWEGHHYQALIGSFSYDGGSRWTTPHLVQDTPGLPDFDASFIMKGNRIWLFYVHNAHYVRLRGMQLGLSLTKVLTSRDGARTWDGPKEISAPFVAGPRANGIVTASGRLLMPVYSTPEGAFCLFSDDDGETWRASTTVTSSAGHEEPTVVELFEGTLLMYLRTTDGFMWETRSEDDGETWSNPGKTSIKANKSSHVLWRLNNGTIALLYNPCDPLDRTELVVRFSDDEAMTWGPPLTIAKCRPLDPSQKPIHPSGVDNGVTYPSIADLGDGRLVAVWAEYWISETEHWGDIKYGILEKA